MIQKDIHGYSHKKDPGLIQEALDLLHQDGILAVPSDTIYGLVCRYNPAALKKLHEIRQRPLDKPFLFVIGAHFKWQELIDSGKMTQSCLDFALSSWPGRITCVFPKNPELAYPIGPTIAMRMPSPQTNAFFYELVQAEGLLAAPSLNRSGQKPLSTLPDILAEFSDILDAVYFDAGYEPASSPSEIYDCTGEAPVRLR